MKLPTLRGALSPWIISGAIFLAFTLWMLSGLFRPSSPARETRETEVGRPLLSVQVRELRAEPLPREVVAFGRTEPAREVLLRAETQGRVCATPIPRGSSVKAGQVIVRIDPEDRPQRLRTAQAALAQAKLEHDSALSLHGRSLIPDNALAAAATALRAAEEALARIETELEKTVMRAPFDGVLQERLVEEGKFLTVGDAVARILELDPLVVRADVTEFDIHLLAVEEPGTVELSNGERRRGRVRFVASAADPALRTYRVEMELPNPGPSLPAGLSATLRIETETVLAHAVPTSLISIDDKGVFGVKHVDPEGVVRFVPADLVRSSPDTFWLAGLPETMRLITVGQGFAKEGDAVHAVPETLFIR